MIRIYYSKARPDHDLERSVKYDTNIHHLGMQEEMDRTVNKSTIR